MKSSLAQRVAVVFALALASAITLGIVQYRTARRLTDDNRRVSHTQAVLRELESTRWLLNSADASAQSYVLTGDAGDVKAFNQAASSLDEHLQSLQTLTVDNPAQQRRLRKLEPQVRDVLHALQEEINSRKSKSSEAPTLLPLGSA